MPNVFIDRANIVVKSGKGGSGKVSFRREKYLPRGGPDGGDGGSGGDIVFKVNTQMHSLMDIIQKKYYVAEDGLCGGSANKSGRSGKDLVIEVPSGTTINSNSGLLHDMEDDPRFVLLKGGRGGKGNAFFKSSTNRAPYFAQPGEPAKELEITLELKLLSDVGIIGLPNAGKSQFLAFVSNARPKVADYPFTTIVPNLGVVKPFDDRPSFTISDIPGLIEGASEGVGLGINFLQHVERTKVLVHMLDCSVSDDLIERYNTINNELKAYDKNNSLNLSGMPQIVVLNKIDLVDEFYVESIKAKFVEKSVHPISAVTGKGIKHLMHKILDTILSEYPVIEHKISGESHASL